MSRRYACPISHYHGQGVFIELPDRWLGSHLMAYQDAGEKLKAIEKPLPSILSNLARHAVLLHDWSLPGLNGNPDKWDLSKVDLEIVMWVNTLVSDDFAKVFSVPKNWPPPSQNGQAADGETVTSP